MATAHDHALSELLDLANKYPSPHNGQPMVLSPAQDGSLGLYFETDRGLTATPISYLFSFVSIGVFLRHLELCAEALGHKLTVHLELPEQAAMSQPNTRLKCARVFVDFSVVESNDALKQVILSRQTSRKKYTAGISIEEQSEVARIADVYHLKANFLTAEAAQKAIWLNQRAVFDDMFDPAVREELQKWLRFSAAEKQVKRDGLAYDCMELSGRAMKFSIEHYKLLHWPILAPLMKNYYLRTMRDNSTVGYLTAPFRTELQAYQIGRCIIDIWIKLSQAGHYLHPFGTIVSNDAAHADFAKLVGLDDESRDEKYVVFIFRAGASLVPIESERLSVRDHLYNTEQV